VSTPHDPDDDPTGGTPDDLSGGVSDDDDAAWRSIVENFGDRHDLGADEEEPAPEAPPSPRGLLPDEQPVPRDPEDHYVPPPPPPLPRPEPRRLLAWVGLFGVPTFVLLALVTRIALPSWLGLILIVWFVGGFVYLVASMRPSSGDDYDDGAVL
jgi:hypothetical protein